MIKNITIKRVFIFVILALFLRIYNFSFPTFTTEEAKIAFRGYALAISGRDELGRFLPILFNSLTDYQLPVTSYITALGEAIFGKTDFGVRIPFLILGIAIVIMGYKNSQLFNQRKIFWITNVLVLIFSPVLIFLSKIPNDTIVLTFLIMLLFYLLTSTSVKIFLLVPVMILSLGVSKFAWFIVPPFVIFTLFYYQNNLANKAKIALSIISLILTIIVIGFYLQVPQSRRSLSENNFSIFSSSTIKNGINRIRGQGIESGWSNFAEVVLFNKSDFFIIGFIHWLSNLKPGVYFGQLDGSGQLNFSQAGAFSMVLVIPFTLGLVYLVRMGSKKERLLLGFLIILTFPTIFIYPNYSQSLVVLTLPFVALIIAFGFLQLNRMFSLLLISLMALELGLNLFYLSPEKKETNFLRPDWVKILTQDVYNQSLNHKTALSDNIASDVVNFIEWYNPIDVHTSYTDVSYPYKFRQSNIQNIKIIGSDNQPYSCITVDYESVFVSRRDLDRIKDSDMKVLKTYHDNLNQEVGYLLNKGLCIK